ncbi:type II secretion system protein [Amycolatopsis minnesotensis]|uniref:type II secretion system F family protein n=1 Tax=Amycolatopsis minnesotensis TaxID=337894 RepID=UPI0031D1A549
MVTCSLLLSGCALLSWPADGSAARLRGLWEAKPRSWQVPAGWWRVASPVAVIALAAVAGGPAGAVAAGLLTAAVRCRWRAERQARVRRALAAALADAMRAMVTELRAGAHPARAVEVAAEDSPPALAGELRELAGHARLGVVPRGRGTGATDALRRAWALADEHGVPLAEAADSVRRGVVAEAAFAAQCEARMAGPRASAAVLALLPVFGVALGEAMGASPVRVLTGTVAGQLLAVAGCALLFAGVVWSSRVTGRAVTR